MSLATAALLLVTTTLPGVGALPLPGNDRVAVVADPACPVVIEQVVLERTARGVVLFYSIRNNARDGVKGIVLTAAAVDWTGSVKHIQLLPLAQSIAAGASAEQRATFTSLELSNADRIHFGVQAVQWKGKRAEWRGALKLNAPVALAARN